MHYLISGNTVSEKKNLALFQTLITMAQNQSLDQIKISELCKNAEVSRQFYYQHFTSKEQIINTIFDQQYQQYLRIVHKYQVKDIYQMSVYFFQFFEEFRKPMQQMINADLEYLIYYNFRDYFIDMLKNNVVVGHHEYSTYWSSFTAGGLTELLIAWIQNSKPESPEKIAQILVDFTETH